MQIIIDDKGNTNNIAFNPKNEVGCIKYELDTRVTL